MVKDDKKFFLGIDIGGSAIKYGWGNSIQGLQVADKAVVQDNRYASLQVMIAMILDKVDMAIGLNNIIAIGVGTPGTIDIQTGKIVGVNPNLPEWTDIEVSSVFPEYLRARVFVENDANLMALAEADYLGDKNVVIGVTIGSGIGCGIVTDGIIYRGSHGYAGELGHTTVAFDGAECNCGRHGCLEAYSSVNGLINRINQLNPESGIKNMVDVIDLAKENLEVNRLFIESINHLAVALSNVATLFDADSIVIGGGVVELEEYPFVILREKILDLLPNLLKNKIMITKAHFGNSAGIIGAMNLAESQISEFKE